MGISISSALAVADANVGSTTVAERDPKPAVNTATDTVQLTEAQQVYQLFNQGQLVSEIAAQLNLTVSAVNLYLGVTSG